MVVKAIMIQMPLRLRVAPAYQISALRPLRVAGSLTLAAQVIADQTFRRVIYISLSRLSETLSTEKPFKLQPWRLSGCGSLRKPEARRRRRAAAAAATQNESQNILRDDNFHSGLRPGPGWRPGPLRL